MAKKSLCKKEVCDKSGCERLVLWENDVGVVKEACSYNWKGVGILTYGSFVSGCE